MSAHLDRIQRLDAGRGTAREVAGEQCDPRIGPRSPPGVGFHFGGKSARPPTTSRPPLPRPGSSPLRASDHPGAICRQTAKSRILRACWCGGQQYPNLARRASSGADSPVGAFWPWISSYANAAINTPLNSALVHQGPGVGQRNARAIPSLLPRMSSRSSFRSNGPADSRPGVRQIGHARWLRGASVVTPAGQGRSGHHQPYPRQITERRYGSDERELSGQRHRRRPSGKVLAG